MLYYKVLEDFAVLVNGKQIFLVENELITAKEAEKMNLNVNAELFEPVHISKNKIYWMFGARFKLV